MASVLRFQQLDRNLKVILAAAALRSLGVGVTGVLLGVYLSRQGFSATFIGLVVAAGLAGSALATLAVSLRADALGRRLTLIALALLGAAGGIALVVATAGPTLLLVSLLGMLNGMGTDRGPAFALEQAIIPQLTSVQRRTLALSWYALILDAGHALGALMAALPCAFARLLKVDLLVGYKLTFGLYAALNLVAAAVYLFLTPQAEVVKTPSPFPHGSPGISPQSRSIVRKLAALSGLDSLGGGFLSDALIAYWFFLRFGIPEVSLGPLFFAGHVLNSVSYLGAAWLARRIGLVNTMVFTHLPSNLFIIAVPFAPTSAWAVLFYLAREALVEMDVPTRQSYIAGVVQPGERTYASGVTNLVRNFGRASSPSLAGYLMRNLALGTPLVAGGGLKIVYDFLLYRQFSSLKPPEERATAEPRPVALP